MKKLFTFVSVLLLAVAGAWAQSELVVDMTSAVKDATCDGVANWTNNGFKDNHRNASYDFFSGYFIEQWAASTADSPATLGDIDVQQTISVNRGTYLLSAAIIAVQQAAPDTDVDGVYLYANEDKVACHTGDGAPVRFYVLTEVQSSEMTIGFKTESCDANWVAIDNVELTYFPKGVPSVEAAITLRDMKADIAAANAAYTDSTKMQKAAYETVAGAAAAATALLTGSSVDEAAVTAAAAALKDAMAAAAASVEAYAALQATITAASAVLEEYADNQEAANPVAALISAIDAATATYDAATADVAEVEAKKAAVEEASATLQVSVQIYECLDAMDEILNNCVVGTKYGQYPQAQYDKIEMLQRELSEKLEQYEKGELPATEILPYVETVSAAIEKFYASMITIDFSLANNYSLWPYDEENPAAVTQHELYFRYPGEESPFSFGSYVPANSNVEIWENCTDSGTGKSAAGIYTWFKDSETANVWLYFQMDGVFHPLTTNFPSTIFTAPTSGIYIVHAVISSQDEARVSKNRGDLAAGAYFISHETGNASQIGADVPYNYNTDPAKQHFYINLQEGDKVAIVGAINSNNGNALSKVDTLYVLGDKDEENGYSKTDAEESGYMFFNPYTTAEDWSSLENAIEQLDTEVLKNENIVVGDGFAEYPESAFNELDSISKVGRSMLNAAIASQPEVDGMANKLLAALSAFYGTAGYGLCMGVQEAPNDSTIFVNHQYMPDGLYYIRDTKSGLYVTAPASESDKQSIPLAALIDESMTLQNAQVWHFAYDEEYWVYGVTTHSNDGNTWTIEDEMAQPNDNGGYYGYYHLAENGQARLGTSRFLLEDRTTTVWRTFRVYTNGTTSSMIAANGEDWLYTFGTSGSNGARVDTNGTKLFTWEIIPFGNVDDHVNQDTADVTPVSQTIYNVQGTQLGGVERGINVVRTVYSDGTVKTAKMLVR